LAATPFLSLLVAVSVLVPVLGDTFPSMIRQWNYSAYQQCYLIPPASAWLAWRLRFQLRRIDWFPSTWAVVGVLAAAAIWLLGTLSEVQLLRHVAGVSLIPLGVWAIAGSRVVAVTAFAVRDRGEVLQGCRRLLVTHLAEKALENSEQTLLVARVTDEEVDSTGSPLSQGLPWRHPQDIAVDDR